MTPSTSIRSLADNVTDDDADRTRCVTRVVPESRSRLAARCRSRPSNEWVSDPDVAHTFLPPSEAAEKMAPLDREDRRARQGTLLSVTVESCAALPVEKSCRRTPVSPTSSHAFRDRREAESG